MSDAVVLEGCLNFRDLGGIPTRDGRHVRTGLLYRSDALHHLTPADVALLRDQLGIGSVIDLRSTAELQSEGQGPLAEQPIAFHHVPLFDGDTRMAGAAAESITLGERYVLLAELARDPIARVVTLIAEAPAPLVYHCAAGKDRTGVISAVLLGLLGVDDEVIVADYATSRENLDAIVERLRSMPGYRVMLDALPPDTMHAEPETMRTFLAALAARHGSVAGYARTAGVGEEALARLADRLIG
jgi:protein tyrosine/serine phosphatase